MRFLTLMFCFSLLGISAQANPFFGALITCRGECLVVDAKSRHVESLGSVKGTSEDLPLEGFAHMNAACDKLAAPHRGGARTYLVAHDVVQVSLVNDKNANPAAPCAALMTGTVRGVAAPGLSAKGISLRSLDEKISLEFENVTDYGAVIAFDNVKLRGALAKALSAGATSALAEKPVDFCASRARFTDCALEYPELPPEVEAP